MDAADAYAAKLHNLHRMREFQYGVCTARPREEELLTDRPLKLDTPGTRETAKPSSPADADLRLTTRSPETRANCGLRRIPAQSPIF